MPVKVGHYLVPLDLEHDRGFDPHSHVIPRGSDDAPGALFTRVTDTNKVKGPLALARQKMELDNAMVELGLNVDPKHTKLFDEGYGVTMTGASATPAFGSLCCFIFNGKLDGGWLVMTKVDRISQLPYTPSTASPPPLHRRLPICLHLWPLLYSEASPRVPREDSKEDQRAGHRGR